MKFALEAPSNRLVIRGYEPGTIAIGETTYHSSLMLSGDWLDAQWSPQTLDELSAGHFHAVIEKRPELLILGTGERQIFPTPQLFAELINAGIGYEVMDTAAACRTFNILLGEGRAVMAALLPR